MFSSEDFMGVEDSQDAVPLPVATKNGSLLEPSTNLLPSFVQPNHRYHRPDFEFLNSVIVTINRYLSDHATSLQTDSKHRLSEIRGIMNSIYEYADWTSAKIDSELNVVITEQGFAQSPPNTRQLSMLDPGCDHRLEHRAKDTAVRSFQNLMSVLNNKLTNIQTGMMGSSGIYEYGGSGLFKRLNPVLTGNQPSIAIDTLDQFYSDPPREQKVGHKRADIEFINKVIREINKYLKSHVKQLKKDAYDRKGSIELMMRAIYKYGQIPDESISSEVREVVTESGYSSTPERVFQELAHLVSDRFENSEVSTKQARKFDQLLAELNAVIKKMPSSYGGKGGNTLGIELKKILVEQPVAGKAIACFHKDDPFEWPRESVSPPSSPTPEAMAAEIMEDADEGPKDKQKISKSLT